jgi:glucoamylase
MVKMYSNQQKWILRNKLCTIALSLLVGTQAQARAAHQVESHALGRATHAETFNSSFKHIMANLNNPRVTTGAIIASPSQNSPNYFYHWLRDAGLTMMSVVDLYTSPLPQDTKLALERRIYQWIDFEKRLQSRAGGNSEWQLGEPLFTVAGDLYPNGWGRPQTDGPGIRSLAMTKFAFALISQGRVNEARNLYASGLPATTPIKKDLEFVAHHWQDQSFDVWEEVRGEHFFTQLALRAAMLKGADLAEYFDDRGAAGYYRIQAQKIESALLAHRSQSRDYIIPTLNQTGGWQNRTSELDVSIVIASLYFSIGDGFFTPKEAWVVKTANKLESTFASVYHISHDGQPVPAIGRYPEDQYDGSGMNGGNPWILATNSFAEYYCRKSPDSMPRGRLYLDRTMRHMGPNGEMSEQYNRQSGFLQGAHDLTWSYASFLRAYRACYPNRESTANLHIHRGQSLND